MSKATLKTAAIVDASPQGTFLESLQRNNSKIRQDRAQAIAESTQLFYKREIEDMQIRLKQLMRDKNNMLDLSPTSADSLVLASDFSAQEFVKKDIKIGLDIRNLSIALETATQSYTTLFGPL